MPDPPQLKNQRSSRQRRPTMWLGDDVRCANFVVNLPHIALYTTNRTVAAVLKALGVVPVGLSCDAKPIDGA